MADASLDDMLLEAAGRTAKSPGGSRLPSRPQKRGRRSSSDEEEGGSGFEEEEEEEEDEEEEEEDDFSEDETGRRGRSRSSAGGGSRMPLKKRFDSVEKDDEEEEEGEEGGGDDDEEEEGEDRRARGGGSNNHNNNNGYESDISFGSDLYKDEDDRAKLASMSELDREMILHDRAEMRDNFMMRKRAEARQKKERGGETRPPPPPPPSAVASASPATATPRMRSSVRDSSRSVKENALNELVARRQKAHDSGMQRRRREVTSSTPVPPGKRRGDRTKRGSHDSSAESDYDAAEDSDSDRDGSDTNDAKPTKKAAAAAADNENEDYDDDVTRGDKPTFEDIRSITIKRSKLAKWYMEPYFEDIIPGCFVRVGIGMGRDNSSMYRLCLVRNVDAQDPRRKYKFSGRTTHKYLNVVWGDESTAARWQMERISNADPTEKEFKDWEHEVEIHGSRRITTADIAEKKEAIAELSKFVYSAALVKQMLHEKKMMSSKPANIAAEKDRITKELAVNETNGDHAEAERARARLKELELYSAQSQSKDAKALALARMNQKNRFENFKNASMIKPINSFAKAGEAGYDPFSRRWTRSQNYYARAPVVVQTDEAATDATLAAAAAPAVVEAKPLPENAYALQDFDLPISLAGLQKFGGAQGAHLAYIARKQRLEATCGVQIGTNDGRRHTLTLTVNDYKRRRGLL